MDVIGYIATIFLNTALIWQNLKSWKSKSTTVLSFWWTIQFNAGLLLWVVYGISIKNMPLIIGGGFELLLTMGVTIAKIKFK